MDRELLKKQEKSAQNRKILSIDARLGSKNELDRGRSIPYILSRFPNAFSRSFRFNVSCTEESGVRSREHSFCPLIFSFCRFLVFLFRSSECLLESAYTKPGKYSHKNKDECLPLKGAKKQKSKEIGSIHFKYLCALVPSLRNAGFSLSSGEEGGNDRFLLRNSIRRYSCQSTLRPVMPNPIPAN